jgi:hypothetical protein
VGSTPLPQPPVLQPTRILLRDPHRIAHQQGPDALLDGEGDHLLGGLVLGLVNPAAMAPLDAAKARSGAPPTPGTTLPRLGRPPSCLSLACLLILTVQVALGTDCSP